VLLIGQKWELKADQLGPRPVLGWRVEGNPKDAGALFLESRGSITEPLSFDDSTRGVGRHIPPEDRPSSKEVAAGDPVAVVVEGGEVG
jgi:hypothetical protein